MVLVLLLLLGVQLVSGLGANDGLGVVEGPLAKHIGDHASYVLTVIHSYTVDVIAIAAVVLHLLAIVLYAAIKGQNWSGR